MTAIGIDGEDWLIDGAPTYPGRTFRGWRIEGLARKRAFFDFLAEVTGAAGPDPAPASRAERIDR